MAKKTLHTLILQIFNEPAPLYRIVEYFTSFHCERCSVGVQEKDQDASDSDGGETCSSRTEIENPDGESSGAGTNHQDNDTSSVIIEGRNTGQCI